MSTIRIDPVELPCITPDDKGYSILLTQVETAIQGLRELADQLEKHYSDGFPSKPRRHP